MLGKKAGLLQKNIAVGYNTISGTLKYVTGYTGYSGDSSLQSGNFMALKVSAPDMAVQTTIELVGGTKGPVALDSDMNAVIRITDKDTQKIRVISSLADGTEVIRTFSLAGLTCEAQANG